EKASFHRKLPLRGFGWLRLLIAPAEQVFTEQLPGNTGRAQFCHLYRQLSAQPWVVAGRVVRDRQMHLPAGHRWLEALHLIEQPLPTQPGDRAVALMQYVIGLLLQQAARRLGQIRRRTQLQPRIRERIAFDDEAAQTSQIVSTGVQES